jgi:hypothetical protein
MFYIIFQVSEAIKNKQICIDSFSQHELHPQNADDSAVDWIFFVDTLNFCFWSADKDVKWEVIWNAKTYTGYFALCAAVKRAHKVCYSLANSSTGLYVLYTKSKILQTPNWMFFRIGCAT